MAHKFQPPEALRIDDERVLVCNHCGDPVTVAELPARHLDPDTYVEGACLEERTQARQLDAGRHETVTAVPVPYNQFPPGY